MNTPLLQELKKHLASLTKEEFQKEWAEIEKHEFEGPTIEEFLHSISYGITISDIAEVNLIDESMNSAIVLNSNDESFYSLAA